MKQIYNDGLAPDTRTDTERAKDYRRPEAGFVGLYWVEKPETQWKKYTPRDQSSSLSCMAHAAVKAMETLNKEESSAHPPYRYRANYPEGGMFLADLGNIMKNRGTTLEMLDISQNQNEMQMNREIVSYEAKKIGGYFFVPLAIDAIAEVIERFSNCILVIHGNKKEWTAIPKYNGGEENFGHGICLVDYTLIEVDENDKPIIK